MKTKLLLFTLLLLLLSGLSTHHYRSLAERLQSDRNGLINRIETLTAQHDSLTSRCEVLRLDCSEFKRLYQAEAEQLKRLKIKLRRVEAVSKQITQTTLTASAPLRDTTCVVRTERAPIIDTTRHFHWADPWNRVEAVIRGDTMQCFVRSIDTLHQVVHRIPHRFLFFRWGTKALRQEIRTSNPSTQIVYTDYVIIAR